MFYSMNEAMTRFDIAYVSTHLQGWVGAGRVGRREYFRGWGG